MQTVLEQGVSVADARRPPLTPGKWLLAIPMVLYALLVLPFVFHDVVGGTDLERASVAILYGAATDMGALAVAPDIAARPGLATDPAVVTDPGDLDVSFGYYTAFEQVLPRWVALDSGALIAAINFIGYSASVLVVGMLALFVFRAFGVTTALAASILFAFSPVFLDAGTSGQPGLLALAALLASAWYLTYAADTAIGGVPRVVAGALAAVTYVVSLTLRADFLLALPVICCIGRAAEWRSRAAWLLASGLRTGILVTALGAYLALRAYVEGEDVRGDFDFVVDATAHGLLAGRYVLWLTWVVTLLVAVLLTRTLRERGAIISAVSLVVVGQALSPFPTRHEAKQERFFSLRNEGRAFARACDARVLAFVTDSHYMMLSLIEADRSVRLRRVAVAGIPVLQARGMRCFADFVEVPSSLRDTTLREFSNVGYDVGWAVYAQEAPQPAALPAERRYCVRETVDGWCDSAATGE